MTAPTREPDYGAEMRLPTGKSCSDCRHFPRCSWLISCERDRTNCDWWPSRFWSKPADGALEAPSPGDGPAPGMNEQ